MKYLFSTLLFSLLTFSPVAHAYDPVTVLLFSAPWCEDCRRELPEIQKQFADKLKGKAVETTVYIETGPVPSSRPTQADADKFKSQLGVTFPFTIDAWKWVTFRSYFDQLGIPAAVVLDHRTVLRKFPADSFTAAQLADYVKSVSAR